MPAGLLPLCPTCLHRVAAWTAAQCPACTDGSPVAECDACQKSRAGAFLPDDGKSGGAQRFVCIDCMEEVLERHVSDSMFNAVLGVGLSVVAVRWYGRFPWLSALTFVLFAAALCALLLYLVARGRQRAPAKRKAGVLALFSKQVAKALSKRPGAHRN
ncbi:MAG: hypothetical protein EXS13_04460 [Planctomycetes bacterium]|nr:hypothetical protein [Planctomycetota bacterium]